MPTRICQVTRRRCSRRCDSVCHGHSAVARSDGLDWRGQSSIKRRRLPLRFEQRSGFRLTRTTCTGNDGVSADAASGDETSPSRSIADQEPQPCRGNAGSPRDARPVRRSRGELDRSDSQRRDHSSWEVSLVGKPHCWGMFDRSGEPFEALFHSAALPWLRAAFHRGRDSSSNINSAGRTASGSRRPERWAGCQDAGWSSASFYVDATPRKRVSAWLAAVSRSSLITALPAGPCDVVLARLIVRQALSRIVHSQPRNGVISRWIERCPLCIRREKRFRTASQRAKDFAACAARSSAATGGDDGPVPQTVSPGCLSRTAVHDLVVGAVRRARRGRKSGERSSSGCDDSRELDWPAMLGSSLFASASDARQSAASDHRPIREARLTFA